MNQKKLTKQLYRLGVVSNHTPGSLEYIINVNPKKLKFSDDGSPIFDKLVSRLGEDAYLNYNDNFSSKVKIFMADDYKDDFLSALINYGNDESLTLALEARETSSISIDETPAIVLASIITSAVGYTAGLIVGGIGGYVWSQISDNQSAAQKMIMTGLYVGSKLGLIGSNCILISAELSKQKFGRTYNSRLAAREMYDFLVREDTSSFKAEEEDLLRDSLKKIETM